MPALPLTFDHLLRTSLPAGVKPSTETLSRNLLIDIPMFPLPSFLPHSFPERQDTAENLTIYVCLFILTTVTAKTWNRARRPARLRASAAVARAQRVLLYRQTLFTGLAKQLEAANEPIRDLQQEFDRPRLDQEQPRQDCATLERPLSRECTTHHVLEGERNEFAPVAADQRRPVPRQPVGSTADLYFRKGRQSSTPGREPGEE